MSIKGYQSQKKELSKLTNYTEDQSKTKAEFVTAQENYSNKVGLDVNNQGLARLHGVAKTAEANTVDVKRVLKNTAHGASKGDVVRFESSSANPYFEAQILSVPDANTIILANSTPNDIALGDSFFILRYVSQRFDQTGSISASTGPVQYNLNGTDTVVYQDTVTPANSKPLPTQYLNTSGVRTNLATESNQTNGTQKTRITDGTNDVGVKSVGTAIVAGDKALIAQTVIHGLSSGGGGTYVDVKVNPSGALVADVTGSSVTVTQPTAANLNATVVGTGTFATQVTSALPTGTNSIGQVTANAGTNLNTSALNLETTQSAINAKLPSTLGQKTMANSLAVALASDQSSLPVSMTDSTASGSITTQNLVPAGAATAGSAVALSVVRVATTLVQVTGTYTGALSLQYTVDGSTWVTAGGTPFLNVNTGAYTSTIASAAVGIFKIDITGAAQIRITGLAAMTGTAVVTIRASAGNSSVSINNPIPAGSNIIGALTANQSVNVGQINAVTPLMGNGVTGTGSLRVTVASDNTAFNVLAKQIGKAKSNAPVRNDYTTTNVTTSAYVQLVASLTTACTEIEIFDSSGQTLVLGTGAAASEVDQVNIFPGGNGRIPLAIAAGTRIAIKALSATASVGEININFYA